MIDIRRSLFYYRPRPGDVWEFQMPGKHRTVKTVANVYSIYYLKKDGSDVKRVTVHWTRKPKGRYSSTRVKWLLKYGKLVKR